MQEVEIAVGPLAEIDDPGCREFKIGEGDWPFRGFVVRQGDEVFAYQNYCPHAGHPLNMRPDEFLSLDRSLIVCRSHGAMFERESGHCVAGPCAGQALRSLPIRVDAGCVYVELDHTIMDLV